MSAPVAMPSQPYQQPHPQMMPQQMPQRQGPAFTDDDVKMVKDMFPDTDEEVIRSILEVNQGDKEATINNLLSMQQS